jgi:hypothetical protein
MLGFYCRTSQMTWNEERYFTAGAVPSTDRITEWCVHTTSYQEFLYLKWGIFFLGGSNVSLNSSSNVGSSSANKQPRHLLWVGRRGKDCEARLYYGESDPVASAIQFVNSDWATLMLLFKYNCENDQRSQSGHRAWVGYWSRGCMQRTGQCWCCYPVPCR